jgi:hypothetical protein
LNTLQVLMDTQYAFTQLSRYTIGASI